MIGITGRLTAERIGIISKAPQFPKLHRAKGATMRGRPIAGEEFERMLAAVPKVVKSEEREPEWRRLLRGLYWSGFRLSEALALSWEQGAALQVDLSGKRPVVHIKAEGQKSNRSETMPLAPEFADMLEAVPPADRNGFVFKMITRKHRRPSVQVACGIISDVGEAAGIKTWTNPRTQDVKYATAHDLRRAFGTRWSTRVMPPTLQQMMRHANIATTMRFYVSRNAEAAGDVIYEAFAKAQNVNIPVNSQTEASAEMP